MRDLATSFLGAVTIALCGGIARSQQVKATVPSTALQSEGTGVDGQILGDNYGTTQLIIDRSLLGRLSTQPIRRIAIRRDAHLNESMPQGMSGGWLDLTVRASWTRMTPRAPSQNFAANHGQANPPIVFRGEYRVIDSPALPRNTRVASFEPNVSANIVLDKPIQPSSSGNLCIEIIRKKHPTKAGPALWLADALVVQNERRQFFGRSCFRKGHAEASAAKLGSNAFLGGTLRCSTRGPDTAIAFLMLGASNTSMGPIRLPLDLTNFGAPGCLFSVSPDLTIAASLTPRRIVGSWTAYVALPLPSTETLAGARVYSQWMFFNPSANKLGLTTTNGVSVTLAIVPPTVRVGVVRSDSTTATNGEVWLHHTPVIQLSTQ